MIPKTKTAYWFGLFCIAALSNIISTMILLWWFNLTPEKALELNVILAPLIALIPLRYIAHK